jgi:hypothetical protein
MASLRCSLAIAAVLVAATTGCNYPLDHLRARQDGSADSGVHHAPAGVDSGIVGGGEVGSSVDGSVDVSLGEAGNRGSVDVSVDASSREAPGLLADSPLSTEDLGADRADVLPDAVSSPPVDAKDAPLGADDGETGFDVSGLPAVDGSDDPLPRPDSGSDVADANIRDVGPDSADAAQICVPLTCAQAGYQCGTPSDGCGGTLVCTCSSGTACNPTTHLCTVACVGGLTCVGGCCDGTNCQPGTSLKACGPATSVCQTCDTYENCKTQQCTNTCSNTSECKNGGCCQSGTCQAGTLPTTCGPSCLDCTSSSAGHACLDGACGCNTSADCPTNMACDPTKHICSINCDGTTAPCNRGCCSGTRCVTGETQSACGYNGGVCATCQLVCLSTTGGGSCRCASNNRGYCYAAGTTPAPQPIGTACVVPTTGELACGCTNVSDCPLPPATRCVSNLCVP